MSRLLSFIVLLIALAATVRAAPQTPAQRDPAALQLAAQALKALVGVNPLADVVLQGTATYIAGSDEETGTFTLEARGNQASRIVLNLSGGQRQEVRNGPSGAWAGPDGVQHPMAGHNCLVDADWFYPAFTLQALQTDTTLGVAYLGPGSMEDRAAALLEFFHPTSEQSPELAAQDEALSALDLYLDASSYLPLAVEFNLHPDNNQTSNIAVEVRFGGYRPVNGVQIPFRIQKYLQGSLVLDLAVTSVSINSGVPETDFATWAPRIGGRP